MNDSTYGRGTMLVAKVHLIPLTFTEHVFGPEASAGNRYEAPSSTEMAWLGMFPFSQIGGLLGDSASFFSSLRYD